MFDYNVQYQCFGSDDLATRCVHNTSVWLSNVLSPVAEFDVQLPNIRRYIELAYLRCDTVRQVLRCPGLPLNGSMYETAAAELDFEWMQQPIRCFLSFAAARAEEQHRSFIDDDDVAFGAISSTTMKSGFDAVSNGTTSMMTRLLMAHYSEIQQQARSPEASYEWWFLGALVFIVAGTVGNVLVCLAVVLDRRLHNVTNYFLFSLAIADLLVSLVVMPLGAIPSFMGGLLYWTWRASTQ